MRSTAAAARRYLSETPARPYGALGATVRGSAIDATMSIKVGHSTDLISFAMGSPSPEAIPSDLLAKAFRSVTREANSSSAFDYAPTEGDPALRRELEARLAARGDEVAPECLLITSGGMQGLDLVAKLFLTPGDLVLTESPSYANGLATLHNYGGRIRQIPMDDQGLDVEAAFAAIDLEGRTPSLIYAIPSFQNPSGRTYTVRRRKELLEFAARTGALIIEDDPYSELIYEGERVPSLLELDESGRSVIQVRTFSKILAPGLRVGWVIAPADTIRRMSSAKQSMDTCANAPAQRIIASLISAGDLDRHVLSLRATYPRRRDLMLAELDEALGSLSGVTWSRPTGGMFVWMELPDGLDGEVVFRRGLAEGVMVVPGSAFDEANSRNAIRLCFSAVSDDLIGAGVRRLARAVEQALAAADEPLKT